MKAFTVAAFVTLSGLAAAQVSDIPDCALPCLQKAILKTDCGLDQYCQCTDGSKAIQSSVVQCLCDTNPCSADELTQLTDATNGVCSSALSASGETYTPTPVPQNACNTGAAGSSSTGGTMTGSSDAGMTTGDASAASSSAASSSSSSEGAAITQAPQFNYAAVAAAGLAVLGL